MVSQEFTDKVCIDAYIRRDKAGCARIEIKRTWCGRIGEVNLPDVRFLGQRSTNWGIEI